jgi:2-methylcitrate dehydratase PrpD
MMSASPRPDYLATVAEWICAAGLEDLPPALIERGRWIFADSIGAIVAGMRIPEMRGFVDQHLAGRDAGPASLIGLGRQVHPMDAALLNGTAGTWIEQDEGNIHAKGHPGIQVVPVALAVAQARGLSGREALLAMLLGYEVSSRINRASSLRPVFHPHGTFGVIGAAIVVGKLLGFDPARMRSLMNIAATCGLATTRNSVLEGVTVRNIYTGMSGYMGQLAVQMASSDFTGESDGVGWVYGKVYGEGFDRDSVVAGLGSEFLTMRNYFKIHACGRYMHSGMDLIEDILAERPLDPEAIEAIEFDTFFLMAMLNRNDVRTTFDARFSAPFAVATLAYHGKAGLGNFEAQAVANPVIQALARRVVLREKPEHTAAYPAKQTTTVTIRLRGGETITRTSFHMKGEAERPHAPGALEAKFANLTEGTWDGAKAAAILADLMRLEEQASIAELLARHQI